MAERLNIHIDETGTEDMADGFHAVSLVFHVHDDDVASHIERYENALAVAGLPDVPFHGVKLLHGHAEYEGLEPGVRKKMLYSFAALVKNLPVRYVTFVHGAPDVGSASQLKTSLRRDMSQSAFDNLAYFQRFDEIHVYYDRGQKSVSRAVAEALNFALARNVAEFKKPVYGERRLCQVADYACCVERAMRAYDRNGESATYRVFCGTRRDFRRNLYRQLSRKRFDGDSR
ncbi:MAG: hypothetical protein IJ087_13630 [Eggerthellaceae bacterium]|nr:hypothetical protein [Eggerthellaceae bacterium]